MENIIPRNLALINELDISISLIKRGLGELQQKGSQDYHFLMLTLANGLERLMKVVICLQLKNAQGVYPTSYPWRNNHNLNDLLEYIKKHCFSKSYLNKGVGQNDIYFLENDESLTKFIELLSKFGKSARYYNLDFFKGGNLNLESPDREWQKLQKLVLNNSCLKEKLNNIDTLEISKIYAEVNQLIIIKFEKLIRAFARLLTLAELGNEARCFSSGTIFDFLIMTDKELGNKHY